MNAAPPDQVYLDLLGSGFVVEATDQSMAADVRRLWHRFLISAPPADAQLIRPEGSTHAGRLQAVATSLNAAALNAAGSLAVHAAVVAHDGIAVAMPAESGAGKSTLTAACLLRGFGYVSDEALCLRYPDAAVLPYPRPIALSAWSAAAVGRSSEGVPAGDEQLFTSTDLGSHDQRHAARLRHLVVIDRVAAGGPALLPTARPPAVSLLLRLSFNHFRRPADAVKLAAEVVAQTSVWTLTYSDPLAAADLLASELFSLGRV